MTDADLTAIESRANAATPSPWTAMLGSGDHICTGIMHEAQSPDELNTLIADLAPDYFDREHLAGYSQLPTVLGGQLIDHRPNMDFIMAARDDVPRLVAEVRRLNAVLDEIDLATKRIDAGLDRVQAGELAIVEAYFKRVCARAEATIERTHQVSGAHYAAMQVELKALRNATEPGDNHAD